MRGSHFRRRSKQGGAFRTSGRQLHRFCDFYNGSGRSGHQLDVGAERLFGYSAPEMLMFPVDRIFTPEDQAKGASEKERAAAQVDGRATDERWHQRKDGSRFWASGLMM